MIAERRIPNPDQALEALQRGVFGLVVESLLPDLTGSPRGLSRQ